VSNTDHRHTEPIRQTSAPCQVHERHVPPTHINEHHHVWPKGDGGPDIPENVITVCASGHNSIHLLIDLFKTNQGHIPYSELRTFAYAERRFAKLGYDRITRGAM
jgi:hypothetical protein